MTDPNSTEDRIKDPRFVAAVDMARRTGAIEFSIRYSDDEQPVIWMATTKHRIGVNGLPVPADEVIGKTHWQVGADLDPLGAVLNLCEKLVDGGTCKHCHKPTMFHASIDENPTILDPLFCSYEWDPEVPDRDRYEVWG